MSRGFTVFVFMIFLVPLLAGAHGGQSHYCTTPLGQRGTCVSLKFCPEVLTLFTKLAPGRARQYSSVLRNICGNMVTYDDYPVVCCSEVVMTPDMAMPTTTATTTTTTTRKTSTTGTQTRNTFPTPESIFSTTSASEEKGETSTDNPNPIPTGGACRGPALEEGICKPLQDCTEFLDRARGNTFDETFKAYLRSSNKLCGNVGTNVCCPTASNPRTGDRPSVNTPSSRPFQFPTEEEGCGRTKAQNTKVVGGEESQIGAWPWIVLIGYDPWSLAPFKCGGTLISARHVITAAHCIRSDLSFVRLGEFDISTETEAQHMDVNVVKKVAHPDFGPDKRNDIAVLFLERDVEFTDLICPICMPTSRALRAKSYVGSNPFVAGWGRVMEGGSASNVLRELQIPILENSVCHRTYENQGRLKSPDQFDGSVLCAGFLGGGKDTCQGDSGGPLMIPEAYKGITRYYLLGVVSYGIGCARIGVPGVYMDVRHFLDWISRTIAEAS